MKLFKRQSRVTMCSVVLLLSCTSGSNSKDRAYSDSTGSESRAGAGPAASAGKAATETSTAAAATPPPGDIAERWQTDFSVFARQVEKIRESKSNEKPVDGSTGPKFENKRVRWTLRFKAVTVKADKGSVDFDLEPFGIKYKFFSGTRWILAGFEPARSSIPEWQKIKPGTLVTMEGISAQVFIATITPENGEPHVVAFATIKEVSPVQSGGKQE